MGKQTRKSPSAPQKLQSLCGTTEIVVLPEMFSTGFSMQSKTLAEPNSGETITTLKLWARQFRIAICGSYIATDNRLFYNRAFVLTPEGEEFYYDKRHLFRMGRKPNISPLKTKRLILPYLEWNICLQVCYDLRFPVWSRNINNEYDLLIYVANWPIPAARYGIRCFGLERSRISAMYAVSTGQEPTVTIWSIMEEVKSIQLSEKR